MWIKAAANFRIVQLLSLALLTAFVSWSAFGWIFDGSYGFTSTDAWATFQQMAFTTLSDQISFLAPPNPHLMGDRRLIWSLKKIIYDIFGPSYLAYNTFNIIGHIGVAAAFYFVARGLAFDRLISFCAAFLFFFGAVSALTVAFQPAIQDICCVLFLFAAFALYLRGTAFAIIASIPLYWLSLRSKEYGLFFPVILTAMELINAMGRLQPIHRLLLAAAKILPYALTLLFYMFVTQRGVRYAIEHFQYTLGKGDELYWQSPSPSRIFPHLDFYIGELLGFQASGLWLIVLILVGIGIYINDRRIPFLLLTFLLLSIPILTLKHISEYYIYSASPFFYIAFVASISGLSAKFFPGYRNAAAVFFLLYAAAQTTILPYFQGIRAVWQGSIRNDPPFLAFMATEYPMLPKAVEVYIDAIELPPYSAAAFPIGNTGLGLSLNGLYHDSTLTSFSGETHEEVASKYREADAPKLYIRNSSGKWETISKEF